MKLVTIALAATGLLATAAPVLAQVQVEGDAQLQLQRRGQRTIVLPKPSPETFARDAEEAVSELTRQQRADELIRDGIRPSLRPDLDYDVRSGIQTRNLRDVLGR